MRDLGFRLMLIKPGFCDRETGEMKQADALFVRCDAVDELTRDAA